MPRCLSPSRAPRELNEKLRRTAAEHGHHIRPEQLPLQVITYVAETEQKAREEGIDHIRYFFEDALRTTPTFLAPPGYLSVEQLKMRAALADKLHGKFNFEAVNESFFVAVGTADQVVENSNNGASRWGPTISSCLPHPAICRTGRWSRTSI